MHVCLYVCIYMCVCVCVCVCDLCVRVCMHADFGASMSILLYTHVCTPMLHTYTHVPYVHRCYIRTCTWCFVPIHRNCAQTRICTHTHTHAQHRKRKKNVSKLTKDLTRRNCPLKRWNGKLHTARICTHTLAQHRKRKKNCTRRSCCRQRWMASCRQPKHASTPWKRSE